MRNVCAQMGIAIKRAPFGGNESRAVEIRARSASARPRPGAFSSRREYAWSRRRRARGRAPFFAGGGGGPPPPATPPWPGARPGPALGPPPPPRESRAVDIRWGRTQRGPSWSWVRAGSGRGPRPSESRAVEIRARSGARESRPGEIRWGRGVSPGVLLPGRDHVNHSRTERRCCERYTAAHAV